MVATTAYELQQEMMVIIKLKGEIGNRNKLSKVQTSAIH